jgi:hypothetical protein
MSTIITHAPEQLPSCAEQVYSTETRNGVATEVLTATLPSVGGVTRTLTFTRGRLTGRRDTATPTTTEVNRAINQPRRSHGGQQPSPGRLDGTGHRDAPNVRP